MFVVDGEKLGSVKVDADPGDAVKRQPRKASKPKPEPEPEPKPEPKPIAVGEPHPEPKSEPEPKQVPAFKSGAGT